LSPLTTRTIHRKRAQSFYAGLGVIAVVAVISYVALTAQHGPPLATHTYVDVAFDNVGQLDTAADVRQNSVRIGQVQAIRYEPGRALVTLALDGDRPVYRDAHAAMWDQSALGQKFVELEPGHPEAGRLGPGEVLPSSHTESAADIDSVLNVFDPATRAALTTSVRSLGLGMAGEGPGLRDFIGHAPELLADTGTLSEALADDRTNLGGVFEAGQHLAAQFTGREQELTTLVRQTSATLAAVNTDGTQPLRAAVDKLPGTLADFQTILDSLQSPVSDAEAAVRTVRDGTDALGMATPAVRDVFREAPRPLHRIPEVSEDAKPALEGLDSAFHDARPLAPRLSEGFRGLRGFLDGLAPYSPDINQFFTDGPDIFRDGENPSTHYLAVAAGPVNSSFAADATPCAVNNYPTPGGGAWRDHAMPGVGLVCTTSQRTGPSLGKGPAYGALPLPLGPTGHSDNDEGVGGR
jgi:phospholipid/cholesterol/gamma-HCH transport system substrate-binding protein